MKNNIPKVVLVTDMADVAIAETSLRINKGLKTLTLPFVVNVEKFNLINGSFLIRLIADSLERGDIIIIVCDPRYSDTPRESVCIKLKSGIYLFGPNNGVMSMLLADDKVEAIVELPMSAESKKHPTFNGKYKFAVAVNKLIVGGEILSLGEKRPTRFLHIVDVEVGVIVHIDNYGNIKVNLPRMKSEVGDFWFIRIHNTIFTAFFAREFGDVKPKELLIYNGSSLWGMPEIAINKGNASVFMNARIGDKIVISKHDLRD